MSGFGTGPVTGAASFDYATAFSRNRGWVTGTEQKILRSKRVAIAGMGGVGGSHLLTLTRLGIGGFHLADFDTFELENFNRQAGATLRGLGKPKIDVLAEAALDIHPQLLLKRFPEGVHLRNLSEFLQGVDLYVDGLDFFALQIRRAVFAACAERGIPAITAAPMGMGAAMLVFMPGRMTFEEYFRLEGAPEEEQLLRFLVGLSPAMLQRGYLVDPATVDFALHRGPSTSVACEMCAGLAGAEAFKILLHRGKVRPAPFGLQIDAYRNRTVRTWRPGGNRNPLQQVLLRALRRQLQVNRTDREVPAPRTPLERIVELARWAPSGDNFQPWRFEILEPDRLVVHGRDARDRCFFDRNGRSSRLALGALLETIEIAASGEGRRCEVSRRREREGTAPTFDVSFSVDPGIRPDPLLPYIPLRSTQRRALDSRPLTSREREALEVAVGPGYRVVWLEGFRNRCRMARLLFRNSGVRLALPEAYTTHRDAVEWNARTSEDRIPDQALGLDPVTRRISRWAMKSWTRLQALHRYGGGSLLPRLELDLIPALRCSAHFIVVSDCDDDISAGRAVQRIWLAATKLDLRLQPEMTPLIFSRYLRNGIELTRDAGLQARAEAVVKQLGTLIGEETLARAVFMGRLGPGPSPRARSVRLPLHRLLLSAREAMGVGTSSEESR